jgi:hypothetical protein
MRVPGVGGTRRLLSDRRRRPNPGAGHDVGVKRLWNRPAELLRLPRVTEEQTGEGILMQESHICLAGTAVAVPPGMSPAADRSFALPPVFQTGSIVA